MEMNKKYKLKKWVKELILMVIVFIELGLLFQNNIIQVVNTNTIAISPRIIEVLFYNVSAIIIFNISKELYKNED